MEIGGFRSKLVGLSILHENSNSVIQVRLPTRDLMAGSERKDPAIVFRVGDLA